MVMFAADEIARFHDSYVEAMPDTCTITNPTPPGAPADVVSGVRCVVLRPSLATLDGSGYGQISKRAEWTVNVPLGTRVKTGAIIEVAGGVKLKAGEIVAPASYSHTVRVQCTEVA